LPIIVPEEYPTLKERGLISLVRQPDEKIRVSINRGESEDYTKANILAWLAEERKTLTDQVEILDVIKADVDPL